MARMKSTWSSTAAPSSPANTRSVADEIAAREGSLRRGAFEGDPRNRRTRQTYDNVRLASEIAMRAGADFIKTSTGKVTPAATMPVTLVMLEAIRDYFYDTGIRIGMKPAGGIRTAKEALAYLVMLAETLGDDWLTPDLFRFGASTLVERRAHADRQARGRQLPGRGLFFAALSGWEKVLTPRPQRSDRKTFATSAALAWGSVGTVLLWLSADDLAKVEPTKHARLRRDPRVVADFDFRRIAPQRLARRFAEHELSPAELRDHLRPEPPMIRRSAARPREIFRWNDAPRIGFHLCDHPRHQPAPAVRLKRAAWQQKSALTNKARRGISGEAGDPQRTPCAKEKRRGENDHETPRIHRFHPSRRLDRPPNPQRCREPQQPFRESIRARPSGDHDAQPTRKRPAEHALPEERPRLFNARLLRRFGSGKRGRVRRQSTSVQP